MDFGDYLIEREVGCGHSATAHCGIKMKHDQDTNEHSAMVAKDHEGSLKVAKLHLHLKANHWKHKEHPSGHVYTHSISKHTVTIYHKSHGPNGNDHHEIVLGHA